MKVKFISDTDKELTTIELQPREFSTGSRGHWGQAKAIDWDQKKYYQINAYAVEIGSKVAGKSVDEAQASLDQGQNKSDDSLSGETI